jgi:alpha-tubulin suppressor-like RCC1 family protein
MDKDEEFLSHNPTLVGRDRLKGREIQKLLSGSNHVLLLDKNKVLYAFGDSETFVIGRKPTERHRL